MRPVRTRSAPVRLAALAVVVTTVAACGGGDAATGQSAGSAAAPTAAAAPDPRPSGTARASTLVPSGDPEVLFTGLQVPWDLVFLPGGDLLVSERDTARILRLPAGEGGPAVVTTLEQAVPVGEGGLLGLALSPSFETDRTVYAYLTTAQDNRIVRFSLDDPAAVAPVLTGIPKGPIHNGGRIEFGPDGLLYAGTGDSGNASLAQDPGSLAGKVLRMTPDGEPAGIDGSFVLSLGHRNVQGLAFDEDGRTYAVEFGSDEFDEVNVVSEGTNGGWPQVEGPGDGGGRFLAPIVTWRPAEASPSGAAIAGGSLYVAALRGERLWRVPLDSSGGAGTPQDLLVGAFGRLRTVETGPDGSLWLLTSNRDGRGDPVAEDDRVVRLALR